MKLNQILISGALLFALVLLALQVLAADAKGGKAMYDKRCSSCHGADGKGNPAMVKAMGEKGLNLTTKEVAGMKDDEVSKVILEGRGKMPATKGMTKDESKQVIDYVRTLQK